ncbi:MAG: hypothetical protein P1P69_10240, partial [Methanosarcinaceae archaeon]|nr:hypothetical protein [Methanosarcinaceae archaeon]
MGCHDPHTTYSMGSLFTSEEVVLDWNNMGVIFSKNAFMLAIFCALGITLASKHLMSKYEKGVVILADDSG